MKTYSFTKKGPGRRHCGNAELAIFGRTFGNDEIRGCKLQRHAARKRIGLRFVTKQVWSIKDARRRRLRKG